MQAGEFLPKSDQLFVIIPQPGILLLKNERLQSLVGLKFQSIFIAGVEARDAGQRQQQSCRDSRPRFAVTGNKTLIGIVVVEETEDQRIGVVANRVKKNTLMYKSLMRFLDTLQIPVVTTLRDSQNYIRAAETGTGLFETKPYLVREDLEQWLPLVGWLAQRTPLTLQAGAPAMTSVLRASAIAATPGAKLTMDN